MEKIFSFIKNIFAPEESNMPWVYVSGEGRWIRKKPVSPLLRVAIFVGVLAIIGGTGFYLFADNQADAKLAELKNPVSARSDRVILEMKLNPDNDAVLPPVANTQKQALTASNTRTQTRNLILPQMQSPRTAQIQDKPALDSKGGHAARIKTTVTPLNQNTPTARTQNAFVPQTQKLRRDSALLNDEIPDDLHDYWIKIDKGNYTLSLYKGDEILKIYDVAVGKNPGDKQRRGDNRTPVGDFRVTSIEDSSKWKHDFGDGKGQIAGAYGPWFIRLDAGGWKGIGIHGTHDPDSLGTMASEGCIRMNNDGIRELRKYAYRKMRVLIQE